MNAMMLAFVVLALAAVLGVARTWRDGRPRRLPRIVLQLVAAALLGLCLFPPRSPVAFSGSELVVLTPRATPAQRASTPAGADVVALPGVEAARSIERTPDLGSALRRHPDARRLRVVGGGLPVRDRDAARGLAVRFDPAPLPHGLVELDAPRVVRAGNAWRIQGRAEETPGARIVLRDPSGAMVASTTVDAQGRFMLDAFAKGEGTAPFALRVDDAEGAAVDEIAVPLVIEAGSPLRALLLAGAPDAELKYLRRWAVDAGVQLDSRIGLGAGIALNEGAPLVDAATLASVDVAIVDERAWETLVPAQKDALRAAVDDGLGLLLRVTAMPSPAVAADWAALGFRLRAAESAPPPVALDHALAAGDLAFTRAPVDVRAEDAAPLLRADDGTPLALWRAQARGRVAAWTLADAFRLRLRGAGERHAALWSDTLAALARARGVPQPWIDAARFDAGARVDQRMVWCGLAAGDHVESPQGRTVPLDVVVRDGRACAAYWPASAGWHALVSNASRHPFYVRATGEAGTLAAAADAAATRALAGDGNDAPAATAWRDVAWPRWPFFLAWIATLAMLWTLERARVRVVP